jgi:competence ComEA-like helix-hairpin-helix protein
LKIWQAGVSALLGIALAASLPGLYNYTEAGSYSYQPIPPDSETPIDRLDLKTVEEVDPPPTPDSDELPKTNFRLKELSPQARREAEKKLRVDITKASKDRLTSVTGIGPATAEDIVEYRESNGINSLAELENVRGIGPSTAEKMSREILIDGRIPDS